MKSNTKQSQIAISRPHKESTDWLHKQLKNGCLRQGWGWRGLDLKESDKQINKKKWVDAYSNSNAGEAPTPRRFAILCTLLRLVKGDIVVVPKMPDYHMFTIARVSGEYRFEVPDNCNDFGHIIPVDRNSVRTFHYQANDDAFLVSGLFSKSNHRSAVSIATTPEHWKAANQLLSLDSCKTAKLKSELLTKSAVNRAFKEAAISLQEEVKTWNSKRFEDAVRQTLQEQGYEMLNHRKYSGKGDDADMLVAPPASHSLFQRENIAIQVKWKQGEDQNDVYAVNQIIDWTEWQNSEAAKYVISSASKFSDEAQEMARDNDVVLIGGLQTMCFLLGISEQYRDDWE